MGHLDIAKKVLAKNYLEEIQFIPNRKPPHKHPRSTIKDRLAMMILALKNKTGFVLNETEIQRPSPSYTIDTVKLLKTEFENKILCFILASDAFATFNTWHDWKDILTYCHLIVVYRPDFPIPTESWTINLLKEREIKNPSQLTEKEAGYIIVENVSPSRISATKIREEIAQGRYPKGMLPASVLDYIKEHHLYK